MRRQLLPPGPTQRGYTLLEVMVALALFSLLAVAASAMLDSGLRFRSQLQQQAGQSQQLEQVWQLLEHDLQQLQWRQGRDPLGQTYPVFIWHQPRSGDGTMAQLSFTSRGRPAWLEGRWLSRPQQVSWRLDFNRGQLQRRHNLLLDPAQQNRAQYYDVLAGVSDLQWQFWLNGQWRDRLPQQAAFPQAIRVSVQLQRLAGPLSRVYLLPEPRP